MEPKKTARADLQKLRGLFFEAGLAISLLAVVGAFAWAKPERRFAGSVVRTTVLEQEMLPAITLRKFDPPSGDGEWTGAEIVIREVMRQPVHTALSDFIDVVDNDAGIYGETPVADAGDAGGDADSGAYSGNAGTVVEELEEDMPLAAAEEMPAFRGGDLGRFRSWVYSRLVYPQEAFENGLQGTATVTFVIEKDGSLTIFGDDGASDPLFVKEVVRVLELSPEWTPGRQHGETVRVYFVLPIEFVLQKH